METASADRMDSGKPARLAGIAIAVGVLVLAIKYGAYVVTGSVSLYSDALESIVNTVAAVGMLVALRVAARPADRTHQFGHTKAEYFAAVLEGSLILYAAFEIMRAAWNRFEAIAPLHGLDVGIAMSGAATIINAAMAFTLVRVGRRYRSPALFADGKHLWADVMTTISVVAGIGLAWLTGLWIIDPLLALAVAVHVLWVGFKVIRDSVDGLMDKSLPDPDAERIQRVIEQNLGKALEVHDLRSRLAGGRPFVEFHLVVPADMTVAESHAICDDLERAVKTIISTTSVLIHVEPEEKAKQKGLVVQVS